MMGIIGRAPPATASAWPSASRWPEVPLT
jgi:hypothetical protein